MQHRANETSSPYFCDVQLFNCCNLEKEQVTLFFQDNLYRKVENAFTKNYACGRPIRVRAEVRNGCRIGFLTH